MAKLARLGFGKLESDLGKFFSAALHLFWCLPFIKHIHFDIFLLELGKLEPDLGNHTRLAARVLRWEVPLPVNFHCKLKFSTFKCPGSIMNCQVSWSEPECWLLARCPFIEESEADVYAYKLPVFILLVSFAIFDDPDADVNDNFDTKPNVDVDIVADFDNDVDVFYIFKVINTFFLVWIWCWVWWYFDIDVDSSMPATMLFTINICFRWSTLSSLCGSWWLCCPSFALGPPWTTIGDTIRLPRPW